MISFKDRPNWWWLLIFSALAVGLRSLSFQYSVIDHDESTYTVIAQEMLKGRAYYAEVWDTKPVGIFLVFAAVLKAFGSSVVAIRFAAALAIGLTAFFLFRSARRWGHSEAHSAGAGMAYILMCVLHRWNFAANSELFFNLFTALGLYFFLGKPITRNAFLAGLAIGMGFVIKYFVLFDLIALSLFFLVIRRADNHSPFRALLTGRALAILLGFLLPFACVVLYYLNSPHFGLSGTPPLCCPASMHPGLMLCGPSTFLQSFTWSMLHLC